ncbi:hypothetical protein [Kitasatospora azatica]|uniref:hypothetical protein n=1 Tax=Kitasatospora azatica TaxID=58347 RepID=UPI0012F81473|nr:hypothetical protein [Kitasatospora azatica]
MAERLCGVAALVDWEGSWFREFWQRDTDGMRDCLEGREVPPWDVIESLLQDLATAKGVEGARYEATRLRSLYRAAVGAYDRGDGVRATLAERLRLLREEQHRSTRRLRDLHQEISACVTGMDDLRAIESDLAWARDYHARICSRIDELRSRVAALEQAALEQVEAPSFLPSPEGPRPSDPQPATAPAQKHRRRQRGGARFAGLDINDEADSTDLAGADPLTQTVAAPRGARFSGAATTASVVTLAAPAPPGADGVPRGARFFAGAEDTPVVRVAPSVDDADRAAVTHTVELLRQLRAQNLGGQAHAVLAETAHQPAARFPLLAEQLERAGLAADWATLLWEVAALPLDLVFAAADALSATGRSADGDQLRRQCMNRSALDIGTAVADLIGQDRHTEARAVLDIHLRTRTTSDSAAVALADPVRLVPLLLKVALSIAPELHESLVRSLRVAGAGAEGSAARLPAR